MEPCGCLRAVEVLARDWADMTMGQLALRVWTVNAGRRQEFPLLSTAHGGYEAGRVEVEGDEGELAARRVVCLRATLPKDPSKKWRCTSRTCAARSAFRCKHVHSMNQKAPARGGKNRDEFEHEMKVFVGEDGRRKLHGRSRQVIPKELEDDAELHHLVQERAAGKLAIPTSLKPGVSRCKACGLWLEEHFEITLVCTISTFVKATQVVRKCRHCKGEWIHYDGRDDGIVNMGAWAFTYEMLDHFTQCIRARYQPFYAFFMTCVRAYHISCQDEMDKFIKNQYMFQMAYFDYVTLMRIDYAAELRCKCPSGIPECIVVDGTSIGPKRATQCVDTTPWRADPASNMLPGSLGSDRMLVASGEARQLLLNLTQPAHSPAGLSAEDMGKLKKILSQDKDAKSLLPLLANHVPLDNTTRRHKCRQASVCKFLYCCGTRAPALTLVPTGVHELVNDLVAKGERLYDRTVSTLTEHAPIVMNVINQVAAQRAPLNRWLRNLLGALLKKAKVAAEPTSADRYTRLPKRAKTQGTADGSTSTATSPASAPAGGSQTSGGSGGGGGTDPALEVAARTAQVYPSLPVRRHLRRYFADYHTEQRNSKKEPASCRKKKSDSTPSSSCQACSLCTA